LPIQLQDSDQVSLHATIPVIATFVWAYVPQFWTCVTAGNRSEYTGVFFEVCSQRHPDEYRAGTAFLMMKTTFVTARLAGHGISQIERNASSDDRR
jgi:hypothetical protein